MTDTMIPTPTPSPEIAPAKKSHKIRNTVLVLAVLWAIGSAMGTKSSDSTSSDSGSSGSSSVSHSSSGGATNGYSTNSENPPSGDVRISKCSNGSYGIADVEVTITNHSSKMSNYSVSVNLLDSSGNKVGEGFGASNNVSAGQTSTDSVLATATGTFSRCQIVSVNRYAA